MPNLLLMPGLLRGRRPLLCVLLLLPWLLWLRGRAPGLLPRRLLLVLVVRGRVGLLQAAAAGAVRLLLLQLLCLLLPLNLLCNGIQLKVIKVLQQQQQQQHDNVHESGGEVGSRGRVAERQRCIL
jgi:hypothetical protein